jgi:hypothetical protein
MPPSSFRRRHPLETDLDNFEWLASRLEGLTDEVVVSLAQIYRRTRRNMDWAGREFGFDWTDPDDQQKRNLMRQLLRIARSPRQGSF